MKDLDPNHYHLMKGDIAVAKFFWKVKNQLI